MTRRSLCSAVLAAPLTVLLTAGPALAANPVGPSEGANPGSGLSIGATIALYVIVPALIMGGIAALVWLPGMVGGTRYRPARGWDAEPVWFAGPPEPVKAVASAQMGTDVRGGASGSW